MAEFPQFIRNKRNAIAASSQSTGFEGWLFDGADAARLHTGNAPGAVNRPLERAVVAILDEIGSSGKR